MDVGYICTHYKNRLKELGEDFIYHSQRACKCKQDIHKLSSQLSDHFAPCEDGECPIPHMCRQKAPDSECTTSVTDCWMEYAKIQFQQEGDKNGLSPHS